MASTLLGCRNTQSNRLKVPNPIRLAQKVPAAWDRTSRLCSYWVPEEATTNLRSDDLLCCGRINAGLAGHQSVPAVASQTVTIYTPTYNILNRRHSTTALRDVYWNYRLIASDENLSNADCCCKCWSAQLLIIAPCNDEPYHSTLKRMILSNLIAWTSLGKI